MEGREAVENEACARHLQKNVTGVNLHTIFNFILTQYILLPAIGRNRTTCISDEKDADFCSRTLSSFMTTLNPCGRFNT